MPESIFDYGDVGVMQIASDFRFLPNDEHITHGITPNLIAETFGDWLDNVIDNVKEIDKCR
jgi:hypothetical protein